MLLGHRDGEREEEEDQQEGDKAKGARDDVHLGLKRHAAALERGGCHLSSNPGHVNHHVCMWQQWHHANKHFVRLATT